MPIVRYILIAVAALGSLHALSPAAELTRGPDNKPALVAAQERCESDALPAGACHALGQSLRQDRATPRLIEFAGVCGMLAVHGRDFADDRADRSFAYPSCPKALHLLFCLLLI